MVEAALVDERLAELRELQDGITARRRDELIGSVLEVLVDAPGWLAATARRRRSTASWPSRPLWPPARIVKVHVDGAAGPDLEASPV